MNTLIFSLAWTILFTIGVIFAWRDPAFAAQALWFKLIFAACPLAGLVFVHDSLRKLRRYRSVRTEQAEGRTWFVWTELNGAQKRSLEDPRPAWEAEDKNFAN